MTISFINQEKQEITKIDWKIDSYEISRKYMAAEFPSVVLLRLIQITLRHHLHICP